MCINYFFVKIDPKILNDLIFLKMFPQLQFQIQKTLFMSSKQSVESIQQAVIQFGMISVAD